MSLPVRLCLWFHTENVLVMTSVECLAILFGRESEADGCSLSVWKINANSGLPVPLQALHQSLSIFLQLIRKKKRERAILHRDAARLFYQEVLLSIFTQQRCYHRLLFSASKHNKYWNILSSHGLARFTTCWHSWLTAQICWRAGHTAESFNCINGESVRPLSYFYIWKACVLRLMNSLYRRCRSDGVVKSCAL